MDLVVRMRLRGCASQVKKLAPCCANPQMTVHFEEATACVGHKRRRGEGCVDDFWWGSCQTAGYWRHNRHRKRGDDVGVVWMLCSC